MLPPALEEVLHSYEEQVESARDRVRLFQSGAMSTFDLGPPKSDTTSEAVKLEEHLIANFQRGIDLLRKLKDQ